MYHTNVKLQSIPIKSYLFIGVHFKMVFRIVVAGESQCDTFAKTCLIADYLMQNLPEFCYDRIEKSVLEWKVCIVQLSYIERKVIVM